MKGGSEEGSEGGEGRGGEGRGGEGRDVREGGRTGGREGGRDGGSERWREGGREGGRDGGGGMTVIHILIGMFNSNPMVPQYLNNNLT